MSEHGGPAETDGVTSALEPGLHAADGAHGAGSTGGADHPLTVHAGAGMAGAPAADRTGRAPGARHAHRGSLASIPPLVAVAAREVEALPDAADAEQAQQHLSNDVLWRFMDGGLSPVEMRHAFRHLLRGCASCQAQAREVWNISAPGSMSGAAPASIKSRAGTTERATALAASGSPAASLELLPILPLDAAAPAAAMPEPALRVDKPANGASPALAGNGVSVGNGASDASGAAGANDAAYDAVLDRVFSRVTLEEAGIEAARRRAAGLFDELMQHPPARQQLLVHNSARFRDRMLCERLLAASHDEGFRDPAIAHQLARLAVTIAERLADLAPAALGSTAQAQGEVLAGLRARSWAQLGNALRIISDHDGALAAFRSAEALLAANPRLGLIDKARVFDLKASLCRDRRQFAEATRLLDRVITIYRRLGQTNLVGQALAQKANVLLHARDAEGCMALLRSALELIDPHEDPRWYLIVRHNLITALVDDGKPREAFALLFHTRPLYLKMGDRMNLLRLRWLEGQVAQGLNRLEQAEAAFREVRDAFVEMGIDYDAALVSLDLAAVYAQQGRTTETRLLAQEMLAFFESREIHREAMAAFLVFCHAAQVEQAGLGLVREVAAFLKQARRTPDLHFTPQG